ncbi:hypothetical protein GCM10017783_26060 [Deinococcus piscis]|uniref:Uncharacterized protein n=2 Tax=Deinococcus piscis TaxID=394230 RepID=A0ABQ3KIS1_9DEIO|nr:hypothetical protein GCM10017783_26060 [Deinococcus piscis]
MRPRQDHGFQKKKRLRKDTKTVIDKARSSKAKAEKLLDQPAPVSSLETVIQAARLNMRIRECSKLWNQMGRLGLQPSQFTEEELKLIRELRQLETGPISQQLRCLLQQLWILKPKQTLDPPLASICIDRLKQADIGSTECHKALLGLKRALAESPRPEIQQRRKERRTSERLAVPTQPKKKPTPPEPLIDTAALERTRKHLRELDERVKLSPAPYRREIGSQFRRFRN